MEILYIYLELNSIFGKVGPVVGVMIIGLSNIYILIRLFFNTGLLLSLGLLVTELSPILVILFGLYTSPLVKLLSLRALSIVLKYGTLDVTGRSVLYLDKPSDQNLRVLVLNGVVLHDGVGLILIGELFLRCSF